MKNLVLGFILGAMIIGCGQAEKTTIVQTELVTAATIEGYYVLPDGGYIDIYQDAQGLNTVRTARIIMKNADGSTALIPIASVGALPLVNGKLYYNTNQTYVAATHNVKQDSNNALLAGSLFTELTVSYSEGLVTLQVVINSSSSVLFSHSVTSL